MIKSLRSRLNKPWVWLSLGLALILILVASQGQNQSKIALARGDTASSPNQAIVWYRVAASLNPGSSVVKENLAQAYLEQGSSQEALESISHISRSKQTALNRIIKSRALLELNRPDQAIATTQSSSANQAEQLQLGLAYAAGQSGSLNDLIGHLGASRTAQQLIAVQQNHFALAQLLYSRGLLRSSERILNRYPAESSQYYLLKTLITIKLGQGSQDSLNQAKNLLLKGIAISPERIDLRQQLVTVYDHLKDQKAAQDQQQKIDALKSGRV